MTQSSLMFRRTLPRVVFLVLVIGLPTHAPAAPTEPVWPLVQGERPAVAESFGLMGNGFRSSDEECLDLDSIEPRLYLLVRLIMEISRAGLQ
ncbi:MAG: hypothetical protein U0223_13815 [Nitrospira sp.]|nr:hypothetical protein [Nitrospira sp.]